MEILSEEYLMSGGEDRKIIIWDLTKYSHTSIVTCIKRLSSSRVASADFAGNILIWNWLNGQLVHTLTGHVGALQLCSLDLFDEKTLISGSYDRTIRLWNISSGKLMQIFNVTMPISAILMLD